MATGQVLRLVLALIAASIFVITGLEFQSLRSVSGDSLAEAFYQTFRLFSFGMAALCAALGMPGSQTGAPQADRRGATASELPPGVPVEA